MEKLRMCRVCLGEDIRLRSIVQTHLQEMYESLVLMPFETKDSRPVLVCYICCARLKNCYNLRRSCLQSEELFTQMLTCNELESVQLQGIDKKKRLTVHNVVHLSMGHELQMSADNVGVEFMTFDDVKVEKDDPEDFDEDALEEYSIYENIQFADSDDVPLIIVKEEQSIDRTSDPTPKEYEHAVQRNPEDVTSSSLKEHELTQDMFTKLNKVTPADNTATKSTNEETFTLNDNNKERSTSVPHSERVQYTCDTCQQCYSSKFKLENHNCLCSSSHTHTGQRPHQCHVCKKSFSQMSHLTGHMHAHTDEKSFHCNMCEKSFSIKRNLNRHRRTHTGEKPYNCNICKKQFAIKSTLTKHLRTHTGERPYQCSVCKKTFSRICHLTGHMLTHTGEKSFQCSICEKSFSIKRNLNRHMRTHTGEKPYQCYICKKQFSQKNTLTKHVRTHTGEKPYHCHLCSKQFSLKTTLTNHIRTHTGEKPFQCNICKKQFSQKSNLILHMRTHTGEKPHQCNMCKKCFSDRSTLKKHFRTHERKDPTQQVQITII